MPDNIREFASAISGFSEAIIDHACENIEKTAPESHHPNFPSLGVLLDECRAAAQTIRNESNTWTLSRYKDSKMFDDYVKDQELNYHRSSQAICEAFPARAIAWIAWKNQLAAGTLICKDWCDACEGTHYIPFIDVAGDHWVRPCPHCRNAA